VIFRKFIKSRKRLSASLCLSVRMGQLDSWRTDFN